MEKEVNYLEVADLSFARNNYLILSESEKHAITQKYLICWEEMLALLKEFVARNTLMILSSRLIVIYVLNCNIFDDGVDFYKLYLEMEKLKKSKLFISKKYLQPRYINLFFKINDFLKERKQKEEMYGFYC